MVFEMIEFNEVVFQGETYKTREVQVPLTCSCLIGTEDLEAVLMDDDDFVSEEAMKIDERICYYVTNEEMNLPEDELSALLHNYLYMYG